MLVVLDANVLLRAAIRPKGPARRLIRELAAARHYILVSEHILQTVVAKLALPRIRELSQQDPQAWDEFFLSLADVALRVTPAQGPPVVPGDPEDDLIVYTAVAGRADIICTWDQHLYQPEVLAFCQRRGIRVCRHIDLLEDLRGL